MKKKSFRKKPKRTTFLRIFAKAMIIPVVLTIMLGTAVYSFGRGYIRSQSEKQNESDFNGFVRTIEHESELENIWNKPIEFGLCVNASRVISTEDMIHNDNTGFLIGTTYDDPYGANAMWSFDDSGNIIFSNRARMWIIIRFSADPDDRCYCSFDPLVFDIPEMNKLFKQYFEDVEENDLNYSFELRSLYLNRDKNQMIPHELVVNKYKCSAFLPDSFDMDDDRAVDTETITINADEEGFELVEFTYPPKPNAYPKGSFNAIWGVNPVKFDEIYDKYKQTTLCEMYRKGKNSLSADVEEYYVKNDLNENRYGASGVISVMRIDTMNKHAVAKYRLIIIAFFVVSTLIALMLSLIRNARNKAQYAFEDYQRALTNNLAHDIKTPLAVIGGYAENLMELRRDSGSEKELKYLSSIMNNVAYTDEMIRKTLKLSETEQIKKLNRTKVDIKALAERSAEKYRTALEGRDIDIRISGSCEVSADEDTIMTAVENLVSNAVKYARDGGDISITADKKRLCVVNDVAEDVDTKDLLMPFVKGDKARSDKSSSGLGLAIAEAAAAQNCFGLKIDCKNRKFTAMILF